MADLITGRNACLEAMRSGRKIHSLTLLKKGEGGTFKEIEEKAKALGISIEYADRADMDRIAGDTSHQGVIAKAEEYSYSSVDEILALARKKEEAPFLLLLDGIEDPHNLGAMIRTAECAGVHGVIIPKKRSAAVNETVLKTSAGAAEYMRCARVTNLTRCMEELKEQGIWIYACDMGEDELWDVDLGGPVALVIGGEGKGVSRLVRERADGVISMPMAGSVSSMNASNAAAVAMYEVMRQRRLK